MFQIIKSIPPKLFASDWVAIDLELFNAEKRKLHRPTTGTFACCAFCFDPEAVYVITHPEQVKLALEYIKDAIWVFHNAIFDITHLRRWADIPPRKKLWDVMILERIMCGGLYEGDQYGLEDVVRRRLDLRMNKEIRKTFENCNELTDEQIAYNANDAYVTFLACQQQQKEITKKDYRIWTDVDRKAFWPILDFKGFRMDTEAWKELSDTNKARAETIKENMPFNPASPKQVKEVLLKNGFKGLRDTQAPSLDKAMLKHPDCLAAQYAKQIREYRTYAKRASTYGQNFLDDFIECEENNVFSIRASYWVVGTEHGRTSSSSPNMQNIPARETKEFRKCFIARPEHKLVIADMGQQEARIAAFLSQDRKLIEIMNDLNQDIFVGMAKLIYKRDIEKSDPFRKQVKNTTYGVLYGMSPQGMAERYDMPIEDAEKAIDDFFHTFSGLYSWVEQQKKKKDYVETILGRRIWLNPYSEQCERNAINDPICGSAADQMKIALGNIYEKWNFPFPFACVGYIHDELIFDVPEEYADEVSLLIAQEMRNAAETQCPGIPFPVECIIADKWSEKE